MWWLRCRTPGSSTVGTQLWWETARTWNQTRWGSSTTQFLWTVRDGSFWESWFGKGPSVITLDFCQFGEDWKKPTSILSNFWNVDPLKLRCTGTFKCCSRTHRPHVPLSGLARTDSFERFWHNHTLSRWLLWSHSKWPKSNKYGYGILDALSCVQHCNAYNALISLFWWPLATWHFQTIAVLWQPVKMGREEWSHWSCLQVFDVVWSRPFMHRWCRLFIAQVFFSHHHPIHHILDALSFVQHCNAYNALISLFWWPLATWHFQTIAVLWQPVKMGREEWSHSYVTYVSLRGSLSKITAHASEKGWKFMKNPDGDPKFVLLNMLSSVGWSLVFHSVFEQRCSDCMGSVCLIWSLAFYHRKPPNAPVPSTLTGSDPALYRWRLKYVQPLELPRSWWSRGNLTCNDSATGAEIRWDAVRFHEPSNR